MRTQHAFDTVRVADVMTAHPHTAPGDITVAEFIQRYLLGDRHSAYPVTDRDGSVIGLISLSVLRRVAPGRRNTTLVREAAMPLSAVTTTTPDESVTALLQRLAAKSEHRALVVDSVESGGVVGIVTASDLTRFIEVYQLASAGQLD